MVDASPGYEISADGTPRKWNRRMEISKGPGGLPTIEVDGLERLLDEVVAYAFQGRPERHISGMTVVHVDGDGWNCAASNLAWRVDPDWETRQWQRWHTKLMRPDFLPHRIPRTPPRKRIRFFDSTYEDHQ